MQRFYIIRQISTIEPSGRISSSNLTVSQASRPLSAADERRIVAGWIESSGERSRAPKELRSALGAARAGRAPEARRALARLIEREPDNALAHALLGVVVELAAGDGKAALAALDRAVALRPAAGWPLALRSQVRRARAETRACLEDLSAAVEREPSPWIHRLRFETLKKELFADEDFDALRRAADANPRDARMQSELGQIYLENKMYPESIAAFSRGLRRTGSERAVEMLVHRAEAYRYAGRPRLALRDLRRALRRAPGTRGLRLRAARAALRCGDAFFASSLAALPRADASFLSGLEALSRRRYREAARRFEACEGRSALARSAGSLGVSYAGLSKALAFAAEKGR